jgi:hypothetical protein
MEVDAMTEHDPSPPTAADRHTSAAASGPRDRHLRRGRSVLHAVAGAGVACALLWPAWACSGQDQSTGADGAPSQEAAIETAGSAAPAAGGDAAASGDGAAVTPAVQVDQPGPGTDRQVILDGTVVVEVDDLGRALDRAEAAVLEVSGFLASEQVDNTSDAHPSATATYRGPPSAFHAVIERLDALGEVRSQHLGARDVSTEVADLDSRLATLQTSIERLRGFLSTAEDAVQIGTLEAELTRRESEAASIAAQRRALGDQIDFSTISVELFGPGATPPVESTRTGFARGLEVGADAATALGRGAMATIGFSVPFLPAALAAALLLVWLRRRRGRSGIAPDHPAVS